jgi:hypothetical protein
LIVSIFSIDSILGHLGVAKVFYIGVAGVERVLM